MCISSQASSHTAGQGGQHSHDSSCSLPPAAPRAAPCQWLWVPKARGARAPLSYPRTPAGVAPTPPPTPDSSLCPLAHPCGAPWLPPGLSRPPPASTILLCLGRALLPWGGSRPRPAHPRCGMQSGPAHQRWPTPWDTLRLQGHVRPAPTVSSTRAGPVPLTLPMCSQLCAGVSVHTLRRQRGAGAGHSPALPGHGAPPVEQVASLFTHSCERREQRGPCSGHTPPRGRDTGSGGSPPRPRHPHMALPGPHPPRGTTGLPRCPPPPALPGPLRGAPALLQPRALPRSPSLHSLPIQPSMQALLPYWSQV